MKKTIFMVLILLHLVIAKNVLAISPTLQQNPVAATESKEMQETLRELEQAFDSVDFGLVDISAFPDTVYVGESIVKIYWLENKDGGWRGALIEGKNIDYQMGRPSGQVKVLHWITDYEKLKQGVPESLNVVKADNSQWMEIESFHFYLVAYRESEHGFGLSLMVDGRYVDYNESFWDQKAGE